jgi:PBSX family phage terminase large subunit
MTDNSVTLLFEPVTESQRGFLESTSPRILFSGAFGAGKSIALCAKALKLSLDYPNNFGYVCRKVRATIGLSTLKTFLDLVCPQELIKNYNKSEGLITLHNGSQILFGGLDDYLKLGSLGAGGIGFVGIDEAIETIEDDWRMLEGRLRLPGVPHQIFAATNPGPQSHYLYQMFYRDKLGEVYHSATTDNIALPADYLERVKDYEGTYYQRYVLGRWVGLEGLVYDCFNEQTCVIPRFVIDDDAHKGWMVYVGHDFGTHNPAAMFYIQDPSTGYFYAFAEYLPGGGKSTYEHVQEFKRKTNGLNVIKRIGGSHQEQGWRNDFTSEGWPIAEPKENVRPVDVGIQRVYGLHKLNKIFVFSDLKNYLREKLSYSYKKDKNDSLVTDEIEGKSKFHLMDAERYALSDFTPETVKQITPQTKRYW